MAEPFPEKEIEGAYQLPEGECGRQLEMLAKSIRNPATYQIQISRYQQHLYLCLPFPAQQSFTLSDRQKT